jgi:hypothetical protein
VGNWREFLKFLLIVFIGYMPAFAFCHWATRIIENDHHSDLFTVGVILVGVLLGPILTILANYAIFVLPQIIRNAVRRRAFLRRASLTEEAFASLCVRPLVGVAIRDEIRRFIGRDDIADRLLPSDPIGATCELFGFFRDDGFAWLEWASNLEQRFGIRIPLGATDVTIAELSELCV